MAAAIRASAAPIPKALCFRRSARDEGTGTTEHESKDDEVKSPCRLCDDTATRT
jgi:hypothetical protein